MTNSTTKKEPRISFESSVDSEDLKPNEGLKINSNRSMFSSNNEAEKGFKQQAMETSKKLEGHLREAFELGSDFTKLMADTRIPENIGPYDRSFEKENIRKLIQYAINVNGDEHEEEGMGSVSCITLIFKTMFRMRDKMNEMAFNTHKLERRLQVLEKLVMSSQAKSSNEDK